MAPAQHTGANLQQASVKVWWRGPLEGKDLSFELLWVVVNSEENDLKNYEEMPWQCPSNQCSRERNKLSVAAREPRQGSPGPTRAACREPPASPERRPPEKGDRPHGNQDRGVTAGGRAAAEGDGVESSEEESKLNKRERETRTSNEDDGEQKPNRKVTATCARCGRHDCTSGTPPSPALCPLDRRVASETRDSSETFLSPVNFKIPLWNLTFGKQ